MEDTHLTKNLEPHSPPSHSFHPHQTLDGSSPISPIPPPPVQTLDHLLHSSSIPSEWTLDRDETLDDPLNSSLVAHTETLEDDLLPSSPVNNLSTFSSSPWLSRWSSSWSSSTQTNFDETEPYLVGAGLANLGNTCFLNAVLQCFTHTVPLVQGLWSFNHAMPCDRNIEGFCVLCALRDHIGQSLALTSLGESRQIVSPLKFVDNLSYFSSCFQRFQQEDAHEFLQCLLDRLDCCCLDSKTKDSGWSSEDNNFVKQVFGGHLISQLRCCNCGHCSDTYEPLIDLSLEIEDVDNLTSALKSFTNVEKIEDPDTKFTCENCKEEVSVEKQLMLNQAPLVAAFHLKRFKNDGSYVEKIDKYVEYPLELDLQPYTRGSKNKNVELKYELYAIVVHIGFSSTSGHYFCFVRSSPDIWYRLDDSKVRRVSVDLVLSQEAYILFYARQGTPWFSSLIETQKAFLDPNISNTSPKSVLDNVEGICTSYPSVANRYSCEINETGDAAEGISAQFSSGSRHDGVEVNGATDDTHRVYTSSSLGASNCRDGTSSNIEKICTTPLVENNCNQCNQGINEVKNDADIHPQTPPRSPSPDIYSEETPVSYIIPRDHLTSENQVSCKRPLNKALEDSKRREALKLMQKSMPSSRSAGFAAAMMGSKSEGSLNKKRNRRVGSSDASHPSARHKPSLSSVTHPVAAGNFR